MNLNEYDNSYVVEGACQKLKQNKNGLGNIDKYSVKIEKGPWKGPLIA